MEYEKSTQTRIVRMATKVKGRPYFLSSLKIMLNVDYFDHFLINRK